MCDKEIIETAFIDLYQGEYELAFKQFILADDNSSKALIGLAHCYRHDNNLSQMINSLEQAIQMNDTKAMIHLGDYYYDINEIDKMKYNYVRACFIDSFGAYKLASYYKTKHQFDCAINFYLFAIKKNNFKAMYDLGELYEFLNNINDAIFYYMKLILVYYSIKNKKTCDTFAKYSTKSIKKLLLLMK